MVVNWMKRRSWLVDFDVQLFLIYYWDRIIVMMHVVILLMFKNNPQNRFKFE